MVDAILLLSSLPDTSDGTYLLLIRHDSDNLFTIKVKGQWIAGVENRYRLWGNRVLNY